jgi:hypothetical protein
MTVQNGYSARVSLALVVDGKTIPLSHVGPNVVSVRGTVEAIPPTRARIVINIDESSKALDVFLPNGISSASYDVAYF